MGRMPKLSREEQHALGAQLVQVIQPLPNDERLLLLLAGFYGETCRQGLNASAAIDLAIRTIKIHERGMMPQAIQAVQATCPTCGGAL